MTMVYSEGHSAYATRHSKQPHLCPADSVRISLMEQRVCTGVANGLTNPEIAAETGLAMNTIKNKLGLLYRKLGAHNRAELAVLAVRAGLVK